MYSCVFEVAAGWWVFQTFQTEKHLNSMSAACCCTMLCKHVIKIETLYCFQVWTRPGFLLQPPLVVALCGSVCLQVWLQWVKGTHAVCFGSFIWTMKLSLFLKFRDHFINNINKYWKWKHVAHSYSAVFGRWCGDCGSWTTPSSHVGASSFWFHLSKEAFPSLHKILLKCIF